MDTETERKVEQLADNLKKLHLATTKEEALQRAREMLSSSQEKFKKTEHELAKGKQNAHDAMNNIISEQEGAISNADKAEKTLADIKEESELDVAIHTLGKRDVRELEDDVKRLKNKKDELKEIVDEAESVQHKK